MRILRIRQGFQADHSSSSYLFYAVDHPVSDVGQRVAHRFSNRAEVDEHFARYQKWGESELSSEAYRALLGEHYDVMASESYDTWTLMIAVPRTPELVELLKPFHDLDDGDFIRIDVYDFGKRLGIEVVCQFSFDSTLWMESDDAFETLVELLADIRKEIIRGNVSFLKAVADFYGVDEEDEEDEVEGPAEALPPGSMAEWSKSELQQECGRRGIPFQNSWTRERLRQALVAASPAAPARSAPSPAKPQRLSRAARGIVDSLDRQ